MALYEELDGMFPNHTHYYIVNVPDISEALDRCGRLSHGSPHVIQYSGMIILVSPSAISNDITWLTEINDPNAVVAVIEETPSE